MKTSIGFWAYVAAFGYVLGAIYWFVAYEPAGTAMLLFMGLCGTVIAGYLFWKARNAKLPEDDPKGEFADAGDEPIGHFSSGSLWPILMGLGIATGVEGFIYGRWLLIVGGLLFVWATVGLMQESKG
jgi:Cytochrome c oxidase subunit IV